MSKTKKKQQKKNRLDPAKDFDQPVKKPRQARLPEMDDPEIEILHSLAEDYVEIRDKRQGLTTQEVELKNKILDVMHANKKTHYLHGGIEITIETEKEKVKVKAKGSEAEDGDESEQESDAA